MSRISKSIYYRTRAFKHKFMSTLCHIKERIANKTADKYIRIITNAEISFGPLSGKDILEVGCDASGDFLRYLCKTRSVASAVGINPCLTNDFQGPGFKMLKEDARKMPFPDNSFDIIMSISVFEHIHNLDTALSEMYRVLRPGGYLLTEFGPIWSSVWGHHLWFYHGNKVCDWNNTPIPPYAHLLMSEQELRNWCAQKYKDPSLVNKICEFVFRSKDQNGLFYSDYQDLFQQSQFDIIFSTGYPDLPFPKNFTPDNIVDLFARLQQKFPDKSGFGYHVVSALLAKQM